MRHNAMRFQQLICLLTVLMASSDVTAQSSEGSRHIKFQLTGHQTLQLMRGSAAGRGEVALPLTRYQQELLKRIRGTSGGNASRLLVEATDGPHEPPVCIVCDPWPPYRCRRVS